MPLFKEAQAWKEKICTYIEQYTVSHSIVVIDGAFWDPKHSWIASKYPNSLHMNDFSDDNQSNIFALLNRLRLNAKDDEGRNWLIHLGIDSATGLDMNMHEDADPLVFYIYPRWNNPLTII